MILPVSSNKTHPIELLLQCEYCLNCGSKLHAYYAQAKTFCGIEFVKKCNVCGYNNVE